MVYHEQRKVKGKIRNYLIYNKRKNNKWVKKSKYIGEGQIPKKTFLKLKKEFEIELFSDKLLYLSKEQLFLLENLKDIYNKRVTTISKEELENLKESFFTELTYNSNALEGNSLSLEQTSLVINENISPKGKSLREIYEARNHKKAIEFLRKYEGDLNEALILKLHSIILKDISERFAGKYRDCFVRVAGSDFKFPSPEKIPQLIKNLIHWYEKSKRNLHAFELAVIFSAKLVTIHAFVDGNGRLSRLIMNFILHKKRFPWINIPVSKREEYLEEIRKANNEDYSGLVKLMLSTLEKNLKDFGFLDVGTKQEIS